MNPTELLHPNSRQPSKAYLVNELRKAVFAWREQRYQGTTPTTKRLLQFWFQEDHLLNNEPYQLWFCQREAIETLVYVYEVTKKDLPQAREFAKNIDDPEKSPYEVIVSTMMLNEGWDVRNVNFIVGLRPYGSKRKVLPEQVIGRGLRKMFPEEDASVDKSINVLEVIGPAGLTDILEELEKQEGIRFNEFDAGKPLNLTTIFVDEDKLDKNIQIPVLSRRIIIREFYLDDAAVDSLPALAIPLENKIIETEYIAVDMLNGREVINRKWDFPVPKDPKSVIAYYTDKILKELNIGGAFDSFYPLVKKYVSEKLFYEKIDFTDPRVLYNLSSSEVQEKLMHLFVDAFHDMSFTEREPEQSDTIQLSDTSPFPWTKLIFPADKCIFNYVPCDNDLEVNFAKFLNKAEDVKAFSKMVYKVPLFVEYRDSEGNLRNYHPDFIAVTDKNEHIIVETKGLIDVDVEHKDKRIKIWCEDATNLTKDKWSFVRVNQEDFEKYRFKNLKELMATFRKYV